MTGANTSVVRARAIDAVILAAALVPLLLTAHVPLSDLPNHLARQHVLHDIGGSAILQGFYSVDLALVPNLALEIVVQALAHVMPIDVAMRLFVMASVALLFLGTRAVAYAVGAGPAGIYRAAPLLIYGGPFQFGFLSFCFGVGAALLLGGWYLRRRGSAGAGTWLALLAGATGLLLCHMVAFGLFAIVVGSAELLVAWRRGAGAVVRAQAWAASFLVPPFALFMAASPTAGHASGAMVWPTLQQKVESIAAITLFSSPLPELVLLGVALAGLGAALLLRAVRPHPLMLAVVFLGLLWLVAPRSAMGGGYLDYRLPWAGSFLVLALTVPGREWARRIRWLAALFGALAIARVVLIAALWLRWEAVIAPIDASLARLPQGSRLLVVQGPMRVSAGRQPSLLHVGSYAVARTHAFTPTLYASISGQVLNFQPSWKRLQHFTAPQTLASIDPAYSHVLVIDPATARVAGNLPFMQLASGERFILYRVDRRGQAARRTMLASASACRSRASSRS